MLDRETTLEASLEKTGGLGAIAFAVLTGLQEGGADAASLDRMTELMDAHFAELDDADCNVLCEVVQARLTSDRRPDGHWY